MKYNLRQLLFFITLFAFLLFLFRPILKNIGDDQVGAFCNGYRHLGYLFDMDVKYHPPKYVTFKGNQEPSLLWMIPCVIGVMSSIVLHIAFIYHTSSFLITFYYTHCVDYNKRSRR